MTSPTIKRLATGYWHCRWNANQWIQWPAGRAPTPADCFGWVTGEMIEAAAALAEKEQI